MRSTCIYSIYKIKRSNISLIKIRTVQKGKKTPVSYLKLMTSIALYMEIALTF